MLGLPTLDPERPEFDARGQTTASPASTLRRLLPWVLGTLLAGLLPLALAALLPPAATAAAGAPAYPLKKSLNGRYLVDQNNVPYLMVGDSPQALIVNLTEAEAEMFFADRAAHGFNAVWINLLCTTYTGGRADGSTVDGTLPFTTPGDLATPNGAYFAHVDRVLALAAQHGLLVLLDPAETGGWLNVLFSNGVTKAREYGRYLGTRYQGVDNILWMSGNDFQTWSTPANDAVVQAVALGIQDTDPRHLHTVELDYQVSNSLDDATWAPIINLNAAYTYYPTYAEVLLAYNLSNFLPVFMVEANYEFENDYENPQTLRRQEYWTMLSGATGQFYGNGYTWPFLAGWQDHLDTPGAIQMQYVKALFEARAWYDLIPDQNHSVVTAGYGTFSDTGSVNDSDYATVACTLDGTLVMAYMPTLRTLTVDLSKLSAAVTARWYDPSNGVYTQINGPANGLFSNVGTQNFTPPGNNGDGDGDWVLVLETAPTLSSVSPSTGPPAGGTAVTLTGTNFVTGATVTFGGSAATVLTISSTSITATTPAHAAGAVNVVVTNPGSQSGTLTNGFTYTSPTAPTVSAVAPGSGPITGGTAVTITGTNFVTGATVTFGGTAATGVNVTNSTSISATTPAHAAGAVNVVVTNPDGQSGTLTNGFTYTVPTTISFIQVAAATPQSPTQTVPVTYPLAQTPGNLNIVVVGWNDTARTVQAVTDNKGNVYTLAIGPTSGTGLRQSIYYAIAIGGAGTTVTVTFSGPAAFPDIRILEYRGVNTLDRTAGASGTSATANSGSATTTAANELIFGANMVATLTQGPGTSFTRRIITTPDGDIAEDRIVSAIGSYSATAPLTSAGPWVMQMAAFKAGGSVPAPPPTVSTVVPGSGPIAGGTAVTITGANFVTGATVSFGGTPATNVTVGSSTSLTATTPAHAAGGVNVVVTNPDSQSVTLTNGFTYIPPPTVSGVAPGSGSTGGGTAVTITGANFVTGATVSFGGIPATNVTVGSSTSLTATTPAHAAGGVNVVVTNPDSQSGTLTSGFTYIAPPPPTVSTVVPGSGPIAGGTAVTLTGTNFVTGATVRFGGTPATNVAVGSSTSLTATTPAHAAGAVPVVVMNPDGQSGTLANGFTYTSPTAPTISTVVPGSGSTGGGTAVTITGANFVTGATVSFGGTPATNVAVGSSTSLTATTPAHAAGAVNVVVTNPDSQSVTLTNGFTYIPPPTVSGVAPGSGSTGGGTAVTITGTNFVTGATVRFGGSAATSVTVVNSTSLTATTPAHAAGGVNVVVTNPDSQSGTLTNGFTYTVPTTISFIQVAAATPLTPTQTVAVTYPRAQTAGNLNIVVAGWNDTTAAVQSVTDNRGNVYNLAIGPTSGTALRQSIYYAKGIAGGPTTVTVTFSQPASYPDIRILEYRGVSTLDRTAGASGNSATANSGSATTTAANELIFGANTVFTGNSGPGTGFTSRIITTPDGDIAEDRIVSATGTYSATSPLTSAGPWVMQMATFK